MTETGEQQKHLSTIDMMRGIASLSVCFYHLSHNNSFYGDFLSNNDLLKKAGSIGWLGVQMFFVISGFIIPYTLYHNRYRVRNFFRFLGKRWLRIEPPYIASLFLLLFMNWYYSYIWHYDYSPDWKQVFLHIFYLPQFFDVPWLNVIFWTLALEFQYYLFIALAFPLFVHRLAWVRYATILAFGAVHFVWQDARFLTSHSSLFLAGIVVFMHRVGLMRNAEVLMGIGACTLYALFQFPNDSVLIASVLMASALMIRFGRFNTKWGHFTGKVSYSLYLTHGVIGHNVIMFSMYLSLVKDHYPVRIIMLFVGIAASLAFAWIFYRFIEKPAQQASRKISYT